MDHNELIKGLMSISNKFSEKRCGYKHYLEIYNKNKINYNILSNYITEDDLINYINEYDDYSLKEINAAIIIQKGYKKSNIYKKYCCRIFCEGLLPTYFSSLCNKLLNE